MQNTMLITRTLGRRCIPEILTYDPFKDKERAVRRLVVSVHIRLP